MESMALMTKSIGIVTPLVLSIVVAVAPRLISYRSQGMRSHRSHTSWQIVSYMGFNVRKKRKKETRQSDVSAWVKSKRNICGASNMLSAVRSLPQPSFEYEEIVWAPCTFWDWLASPLIWDDGDISLTHQGVVCFWWSLQVSEDSSTTCLSGDKTAIQYRYQGHPAMKWPSGDNLFMNWEAHKMSTIGQPTAVPSIHPTPRQILGSLQHAPMLPSTFDHCWPPCASNSELPEPDMLAAHSHLRQRLCDLMWSTFQCHKGPFPPAVCVHHTFASVILMQGCQAFIAWEGVTWVCSGGWAMGLVGRDYPEGQWVVLHNHSIHHHNPIWHCSSLINSHEKCHHPQDCPWNRHRFQLGDLALRSCDEQHRCMGLNSHGVSTVSVIDAAGVKQVEHKWLNVWDSRWENW